MDINLNLVMQEPIKFQGITIYQPTMTEIIEFGYENFNKLILPYSLSFDLLNISEEEQSQFNLFEDFILKDEVMLNVLALSINFFCKTKDIKFKDNSILIDSNKLNRDNFDEFSQIILDLTSKEKPKVEKPPKFEHAVGTPEYEEGYRKWLKIQENRKKYANKDILKIENVIKTVRFGGKSYIPLDEIKKMTIWTLMDAYKTVLLMDSYDKNYSAYLIDLEHKADRITPHWTDQIKI